MGFVAHAFNTTGPRSWVLWAGLACLLLGATRIAGVARGRVPEWTGVVAIVVGVVLAAVGNTHDEPPDPSSRPVTTGSVTITSPSDGTSVAGGDTKVAVELEDFELTDSAEARARSGFGHLHLTIDGLVQVMPDEIPVDGFVVCVSEGDHEIGVVLVAEDHFGFRNEADVADVVSVTAEGGKC
jgi:hypothetical protein